MKIKLNNLFLQDKDTRGLRRVAVNIHRTPESIRRFRQESWRAGRRFRSAFDSILKD
jgi:hypothetical protein